jgi:hypothetical protein
MRRAARMATERVESGLWFSWAWTADVVTTRMALRGVHRDGIIPGAFSRVISPEIRFSSRGVKCRRRFTS